jgi:lysophospholipase L1-like esterase
LKETLTTEPLGSYCSAMKSLSLLLRAVLALVLIQPFPVATAQAPRPEARFQIPASDDGLAGEGPIRRYEWFRQLWAQRRSAWAARADQDRGAVVLLGDSITQGWGEDFTHWFPGMKMANRGISGDTTRGVLIRLQEDVLSLQPQAVVLLIGTNDLEEQAEPETIAGNMKLILAALKQHNPKMPIVLCDVFPSSASKKRPADKIKKINQLYAALVKGDAQVTPLETWVLFANPQGDAKPEEFPDLLHPNMAGYAKWVGTLRPIFATLGLMEADPYDFTAEPGFVSLFNGRDLTGWQYRPTSKADIESARNWQKNDPNAAAWPVVTDPVRFDGKPATEDGRFVAKNGRLIVTTPPEGRKIQQLSTVRELSGNFILRLEFRATANADSGVFIKGPQLQCRDYPLAGPYKQLKQYRPGDWNELEVTVHNGLAHALCNGEVLETAMKVPATGPIGLEGDRGQLEYRRIRIKELGPSDVGKALNEPLSTIDRAGLAEFLGAEVLVDGTDLARWREPLGEWTVAQSVSLQPANPTAFAISPGQGIIVNGAKGRTVDLISKAEFGDVQVHVEFCVPKKSNSGVYLQGRYEVQILDSYGVTTDAYPGENCGGIYPRWINEQNVQGHSARVNASRPPGEWQSFDIVFRAPRFDAAGKKVQNARFVRVTHNGQVVHENVEVTGPTRAAHWEDEKAQGPLMLQGDHGPVAYRNLRVKRIQLD